MVAGPDTSDDIHYAAAITNWLSGGLSKFLPPNVKPTFGKLALAGHNCGGKTAFALGLRKLNTTTNLKFSALTPTCNYQVQIILLVLYTFT